MPGPVKWARVLPSVIGFFHGNMVVLFVKSDEIPDQEDILPMKHSISSNYRLYYHQCYILNSNYMEMRRRDIRSSYKL